MSVILNTMQHDLSHIQIEQLGKMFGMRQSIVHLRVMDPDLYAGLSNCAPDERILIMLADRLAKIIKMDGYEIVILPIGSPAFMFTLAQKIAGFSCKFIFAHSERVSEDQKQDDGTIKKVSIFKHIKWLVL